MSKVGILAALLVASLALGACARAPQPVQFHAQGLPQKLSEWHVVERDGHRLALNQNVVPYDLNTPLFTDYAHKLRTVWMPPGTPAQYDPQRAFDFPVGTILSKTFFYPLPKGETARSKGVARTYDTTRDFSGEGLDLDNVRLIETRLLVRRESGWVAIPYVWNAAQDEAELARTGDAVAMELVADDGNREAFTYVVPNENQCAGCHVTNVKSREISPLGAKARHLNRDYAYAAGKQNQLAHWAQAGYLTGTPSAEAVPRNADWHDATQPLDARARAYLDINCSHCHSATGPANTTALHFNIDAPVDVHLGLCKPPVAAGSGTGDHQFDIVPGKPNDSILPFRLASTEPGIMMPEQGRSTVHKEGLALIRDWIAVWPGDCGNG